MHYAREVYLKKSQIGSWCLKTSQSMLESTVVEMNLRCAQKRKA